MTEAPETFRAETGRFEGAAPVVPPLPARWRALRLALELAGMAAVLCLAGALCFALGLWLLWLTIRGQPHADFLDPGPFLRLLAAGLLVPPVVLLPVLLWAAPWRVTALRRWILPLLAAMGIGALTAVLWFDDPFLPAGSGLLLQAQNALAAAWAGLRPRDMQDIHPVPAALLADLATALAWRWLQGAPRRRQWGHVAALALLPSLVTGWVWLEHPNWLRDPLYALARWAEPWLFGNTTTAFAVSAILWTWDSIAFPWILNAMLFAWLYAALELARRHFPERSPS